MKKDRGYRKGNIPENAKRVFEGKIFDVYQWEQKLYDGSTAIFERITRPDTIVVFPILPDGRILLVEDSQPDREPILTAPSGRIEEGETPGEAARRELQEETGWTPGSLETFYEVKPFLKLDWMIYVFVGRDCKQTSRLNPDAGEKIQPHPVTFDELIELAVKGEVRGEGFTERVLRAKLDPAKMAELKKRLLG